MKSLTWSPMVISQEGDGRKIKEKAKEKCTAVSQKATPIKALPLDFLKQGMSVREISGTLNSPAGYTDGCPSAAERLTEPVFWQ